MNRCIRIRDRKEGAFGDYDVQPLPQELRGADLLITFGGDGTILHLAKLAALHKMPVLGVNMGKGKPASARSAPAPPSACARG